MSKKALSHYAILGLLCWKPMSGYDIKKMVEVGLSYFWNVSYGQIFPVLNKLVAEGWATKREDPSSGGRRRQVYKVTAKGRRSLARDSEVWWGVARAVAGVLGGTGTTEEGDAALG